MRYVVTAVLLIITLACNAGAVSWEFNTSGDTEGWVAANDTDHFTASGGYLQGSITGVDPYIIKTISPTIDADAIKHIYVRMRTTSGQYGLFFWANDDYPIIDGSKAVAFATPADGKFHEYRIDLTNNADWAGHVNTLRFDAGDGPSGSFEIDYIRVSNSLSSVSWEFNHDGDYEGWQPANDFLNSAVSGGSFHADVDGIDPFFVGPRYPDIDANTARYVQIRMKKNNGLSAILYWGNEQEPGHSGSRILGFPTCMDNVYHDYILDMSKTANWSGSINTLRIDPIEFTDSGHVDIDYIRVTPTAPPVLNLYGPSAQNRVACSGQTFNIVATVRNEGFSAASNINATLTAPGLTLLSPQTQNASSIDINTENTFTWQARADSEMVTDLSVSISSAEVPGPIVRDSLLVVTAPLPALPITTPNTSHAWINQNGTAIIENTKVRMVFYKGSLGYGVSELYVRDGDNWDLTAATSPLSRVSYRKPDGTTASFAILPSSAIASETNNAAQLTLPFACADTDSGVWQGSISFALNEGDDAVKADYSISCSASRDLLAWVGPSLCPGNGSFGSTKSQALFPGLEWLDGNDPLPNGSRSSNTWECGPGYALRLVPHPYKITVPLMAVSGNGNLAAILWNALDKWDGTNAYPSAKFSSPNWYESQNNHLMELFVPSIPKWGGENLELAGTPYPLPANKQLALECYYLGKRGEVLDAVDKWHSIYGTPQMPGDSGLLEAGLATAREALRSNLWDSTSKEWYNLINGPSTDKAPYPEITACYFAESLSETDPAKKAEMRARVNEAVQSAISRWGVGGLCAGWGINPVFEYQLPYMIGHLSEAAGSMYSTSVSLISSQQSDGGWFIQPDPNHPDLTEPKYLKEIGSCAYNAYNLLRNAHVTGNQNSKTAGLKALNFMDRFTIARADYWGEIPQHAPGLFGCGFAIAAYLEGYRITSDQHYLDKAKYWARAGLQFIYTWRAGDRQIMDYATIGTYGVSYFNVVSWIGLPIQWTGLYYAYYIDHLAEYDNSEPWHKIAEGIARSGVQQMNASPYYGTYGDSISLLLSNADNPAFINPTMLCTTVARILGRWGEIDTREIPGATSAYVSSGGRILLGCQNSSSQTNIKIRYPVNETSNTLIYGLGQPAAIYKNGSALPYSGDVDSVSEGWSYNASYGCVIVKAIHTTQDEIISVVKSGSYTPLNAVDGPGGAKALAAGKPVVFSGIVTAGTDCFGNSIYVESADRTSAIRVLLRGSVLKPIRIGQQVEVIGNLSANAGERYIANADVNETCN